MRAVEELGAVGVSAGSLMGALDETGNQRLPFHGVDQPGHRIDDECLSAERHTPTGETVVDVCPSASRSGGYQE